MRAHIPSVFSNIPFKQALEPLGIMVDFVRQTESTNNDLLNRARKRHADLPSTIVRIAEEQSAGRGRFGRQWVSSPGGVLTFSYGCKWPSTTYGLAGLSLIAGIAVQQALNTLGAEVQLKWPNDILYQSRKLAGILVENVIKSEINFVVIGIGVNIDLPSHVRLQIAQPIADLKEILEEKTFFSVDNLMQQAFLNIVQALHHQVIQFQQSGFAKFQAQWNQIHAYQNKPVQLLDGEKVIATGLARGVDEYGQFLLETANGMRRLRSGDISLRPL